MMIEINLQQISGKEFAAFIDKVCFEKGLTKTEFYKKARIHSCSYFWWKTDRHRPVGFAAARCAAVLRQLGYKVKLV